VAQAGRLVEEVAMVYVEQNGAASADNPIIARFDLSALRN
jgi:hypothetical protein